MGGMRVRLHPINVLLWIHTSAASLASSCRWKGLRSSLSLTEGNRQLQNGTTRVGLVWRRLKLRGEQGGLRFVMRARLSMREEARGAWVSLRRWNYGWIFTL